MMDTSARMNHGVPHSELAFQITCTFVDAHFPALGCLSWVIHNIYRTLSAHTAEVLRAELGESERTIAYVEIFMTAELLFPRGIVLEHAPWLSTGAWDQRAQTHECDGLLFTALDADASQ